MDDAWLGNEEREARRSKAAEEHARLNQRRSEQPMQISFGFDLGAGHGPIATMSRVDSERDGHSSSSVATKPKAPSALPDSSTKSSEAYSGSHFANHTLTGSAGQVYQALLAFRQQGRALTSSNSTTRQPAVHQQSTVPKRASQSTSHASAFALPSSVSAVALPADCDESPKSTSEASPAVQYDSSLLARVEKEWRRQDEFFVDFRMATDMLAKETALADAASSSLAGVAAATSSSATGVSNSKSKSAAAIDAFSASGSDEGWCLTMHQPWASLLVCGIKRLEGRTWSSPHRGRLWIHSASHEPTAEEIESVEQMYRTLYKWCARMLRLFVNRATLALTPALSSALFFCSQRHCVSEKIPRFRSVGMRRN
jgi:hypothetical protein